MSRYSSQRDRVDDVGCLVVWLAGVLAVGCFGWLVALLTLGSDRTSGTAALALVAVPSFVVAHAFARGRSSRRWLWFAATFVFLVVDSWLLALLILQLGAG
jgi:hypothetical protein